MKVCGCENLNITYSNPKSQVQALTDVSLNIEQGEIIAVVGESGCGKTSLGGFFTGNLSENSRAVFSKAKLPESAAMIMQEAKNSLHPLIRIGEQLRDCAGDKQKACQLLDEVGLEPKLCYRSYPHQLSGGQAQRVVIARALAVEADLLVADEPTANLDLLTQEKVLRLLCKSVEKHNRTCLFITHDLSIVDKIASRMIVIFEGRIIEMGTPSDILNEPKQPYTQKLVSSSFRREAICNL